MIAAGVIGVGATGARAARQLASAPEIDRVALQGPGERPAALRRSLGEQTTVADPLDAGVGVVVLAGPAGDHAALARRCLDRGVGVVSTSDAVADVEALLALDGEARAAGVPVVVGAGFAPGLSCVLVSHVAGWVDEVDEIHVARFGTGGPACARQHQRALRGRSVDWRDGAFVSRRGGSGRELAVFPDPVGSLDCYRAALPDGLLLGPHHPGARRIAARQAANRRQRFLAWAPMLLRPHPEGRIGAIRVEVRGWRDGVHVSEVVGAIDRPAVAAGAVAGLAARWVLAGDVEPGATGLAGLPAPERFLEALREYGVRAAVFVGSD